MATIEERRGADGKTKTYRAKIRRKGAGTVTKTFRTKTHAERWATRTEAAIDEGRHFPRPEGQRKTLKNAIERYRESVLKHKSQSMQRCQSGQLAWWEARYGDKRVSEITAAVIAEGRDALLSEPIGNAKKTDNPRTRTPASVNRYLSVLSHLLNTAAREWRWIAASPMASVTKPKEPRGRVRWLDDTERGRLLEACKASPNPYLHTVILLALATGCRRDEIMGLRWQNVDLARGQLTLLQTKNGEIRTVPVTGRALEALKEHGKAWQEADGHLLVFPRKDGKKPLNLRKPFVAALKAAKIADFTFHDLRHCTASYLAMNGASLPEIASVLGHKSFSMVRRYAHLSEQHTATVLERMTAKVLA